MNRFESKPKTLLQALKNDYSLETFSKHSEVLERIQNAIDNLLNNVSQTFSNLENSTDRATILKILAILKTLVDDTEECNEYISQIEYFLDEDGFFEVAIAILNRVIKLIENSQDQQKNDIITLINLEKLKLNSKLKSIQTNLNIESQNIKQILSTVILLKKIFKLLDNYDIDISEFGFITSISDLKKYDWLDLKLRLLIMLNENLKKLNQENIDKIKSKAKNILAQRTLSELNEKLRINNDSKPDHELINKLSIETSNNTENTNTESNLENDSHSVSEQAKVNEKVKALLEKFPVLKFESKNISGKRNQPVLARMLELIVEKALFSNTQFIVTIPTYGNRIISNFNKIINFKADKELINTYKDKYQNPQNIFTNDATWTNFINNKIFDVFLKIDEFIQFQNQLIVDIPQNAQIFLFVRSFVLDQSVEELYKDAQWLKTDPVQTESSEQSGQEKLLSSKCELFYDTIPESLLDDANKETLKLTIEAIYLQGFEINTEQPHLNWVNWHWDDSRRSYDKLPKSDVSSKFYRAIKDHQSFKSFENEVVTGLNPDVKTFVFIHTVLEGKTPLELYGKQDWIKNTEDESVLKESLITQKYDIFSQAIFPIKVSPPRKLVVREFIHGIYFENFKIEISLENWGGTSRGTSNLSKSFYKGEVFPSSTIQAFYEALSNTSDKFKELENELQPWVPANAKVFLFIHTIVEERSLFELYNNQSWIKKDEVQEVLEIEKLIEESDDVFDPFADDEDSSVGQIKIYESEIENQDFYKNSDSTFLPNDLEKMRIDGEAKESDEPNPQKEKLTIPRGDYSKVDFSNIRFRAQDNLNSEVWTCCSIPETSSWLAEQTIQSVYNYTTEKYKSKYETMLSFYFACALHHLFNTSDAVQDTNRVGEDRKFVVLDVARETGISESHVKAITENILTTLNRVDLINKVQPKFSIDGLYGIIKRFVISMNKDLSPSEKIDYFVYDSIPKKVYFDKEAFAHSGWDQLRSM